MFFLTGVKFVHKILTFKIQKRKGVNTMRKDKDIQDKLQIKDTHKIVNYKERG